MNSKSTAQTISAGLGRVLNDDESGGSADYLLTVVLTVVAAVALWCGVCDFFIYYTSTL